MEVALTSLAIQKIKEIIKNDEKTFLRLSIQGGGCSGFSYKFLFDDIFIAGEDLIYELDGARFVIDDVSHALIKGSEIDYEDDMMWSGFVVKNPNATSKCGCGTSFSV